MITANKDIDKIFSQIFVDFGWNGLTEDDIENVADRFAAYQCQVSEIARAVEAMLREKNT